MGVKRLRKTKRGRRIKMVDDKLMRDEAQRAANYEAIKSNVKAEVGDDIYAEAVRPTSSQAARVEEVADGMRRTAVEEVVETEREVERARFAARVSQVVDYLFFLVYGLLTIRLLLELFAARESAGFYKFIAAVTDPFYSPFRGLVPSPSTAEGFTLALPIVVALVVYMLLHLAINGLLRMVAHRKTEV
jgi:uncharacterized protein YggT (Ycf19 family)